jgi:hypothetical protein
LLPLTFKLLKQLILDVTAVREKVIEFEQRRERRLMSRGCLLCRQFTIALSEALQSKHCADALIAGELKKLNRATGLPGVKGTV